MTVSPGMPFRIGRPGGGYRRWVTVSDDATVEASSALCSVNTYRLVRTRLWSGQSWAMRPRRRSCTKVWGPSG